MTIRTDRVPSTSWLLTVLRVAMWGTFQLEALKRDAGSTLALAVSLEARVMVTRAVGSCEGGAHAHWSATRPSFQSYCNPTDTVIGDAQGCLMLS